MRDILEAALLAEPDDRALSAAYADYLLEQGDPRGELIRLQLLAEDETLSEDDRAAFDLEIEELLRVHGEGWLGGLADLLLRGNGQEWRLSLAHRRHVGADWWFERGFPAGIDGISLQSHGIRLLAAAGREIRLRELGIDRFLDEPVTRWDPDGHGNNYSRYVNQLHTMPLDDSPALANLRHFRLGTAKRSTEDGSFLPPWVRTMRRIESLELYADRLPTAELFALRSFDRLAALTVRTTGRIAVRELAENPTTTTLRSLSLTAWGGPGSSSTIHARAPAWEPPDGLPREQVEPLFDDGAVPALKVLRLRGSALGDRGVEAMLKARFVKRLTELELTGGCLTDAAADLFAAHRDTTKLAVLNLTGNAISPAALARLRSALPESVRLVTDGQRSADSHVGDPWPDRKRGRHSGRPRR